ncbi:hypothetical protein, partial [Rhizobium metallidurans]
DDDVRLGRDVFEGKKACRQFRADAGGIAHGEGDGYMKPLVSKAMVDAADEYMLRPLPPEAEFYNLLAKPEKDRLRRQLIRGLLIAALNAEAPLSPATAEGGE